MKKIFAIVLAAALLLSLAACAGSTASSSASSAPAASAASTSSAAGSGSAAGKPATWRDYDLSGQITIYTTQSNQQISIIEDAFAEAYPDVQLNFVNDKTGALITRLDSESANVQADVFFGALGELDGTKYHKYFQKYDNLYLDQCFKKDPYGIYNYFTIAVNVLMVNPDVMSKTGVEVKSYQDLLQPELKGKIGNMDPNTSSSSFRNLVTMLYGAGSGDMFADSAWTYVDGLVKNMDGVYGENLPTAIDSGEYAVAVFYEDSALANAHDGMNIDVVYPSDWNIGVFIGSAVVKDCPNPDGAHAVVDYICSSDFQTKLMQDTQAFRPANSTVTYKIDGMPDYDSLPLVKWDADTVIGKTQDIYDKWNEIWTKNN